MCYILGIFSPSGSVSFRELLAVAEEELLLRGRDAVGMYYQPLNGKGLSQVSLFGEDRRKQLEDFLHGLPLTGSCLMLQTRAIPEPEFDGMGQNTKDIQPCDRQGWVTSHNGSLANDRELREGLINVDWGNESLVDSTILPYLFSEKGVYSVKWCVEGSFAIAAYRKDDRRFYLMRNFQPLYYGSRGKALYYSSLLTRLTPKEFPAYRLLCWSEAGPYWYDLYREAPKQSRLVAFSSGLDSTITLRLYQVLGYDVGALFFNYGQQAQLVERHCSQKICEVLNIPWYEVSLPMEYFNSPLLLKERTGLDLLKDAESTFSYVPQRNLIMTSWALAMAEQKGFGGVALGMNMADGSSYPDNGASFLSKLNEITPFSSNWQVRLTVTAPFVNLMKSEMLRIGLKMGVPFEYVCSCYYPHLSDSGYPVYCNNCGSDVHYKNAWGKLGYGPPNLGFEALDMFKGPGLIKPDPLLRLDREGIPYWEFIRRTL
jgi:7-cyano-7-deazaguanine synthase